MKHPPTIANLRPTRIDSENIIKMLCESYPKCFFGEARQRRPLKQNIEADIIKDQDFDVAPEMIRAAMEWYKSHIGYDHALSSIGAKRIDLNGCEVGTVTESEALAARQGIADKGSAIAMRNLATSPVRILNEMHAEGRISDCAIKKLDAPPMSPTPRSRTAATVVPEFAPLYETLAAANAAVVGINDSALRIAVAKASLDVVIKKFQQVRSGLEESKQ